MSVLYTIGTWRVSLDAYVKQFCALGVRKVVDVRGNPQAGRQQELKRGRALENALWSCGVTYEYWGRELGEDAVEAGTSAKVLEQLARIARDETVCLLGHLHEPQGCHRLALAHQLTKTGLQVIHLLWEGNSDIQQLLHSKVVAQAREVDRFFFEHLQRAEAARKARCDSEGTSSTAQLTAIPWDKFDVALFSDGNAYRFAMPFDTEMLWYPKWLTRGEADSLERTVREEVTFYHPTYVFQEPTGGFTKTLIKRGQARVCDKVCPGSVGSTPLQTWSESLLRRVENAAGEAFNCFVANHYADGQVVINWHSDSGPGDDEGLGPNPRIGSLSLGVQRTFSLKSKRAIPGGRFVHLDIPLTHGSLLIMGRNSQTHWLHALPRDEAVREERINLTFRFYARQTTKHIEGVEHNHEWETAAGSTRVLLHRADLGVGQPVIVDVPDDLVVAQLPRYLSTVLPRWRRGPVDAFALCVDGAWGEALDATKFVSACLTCCGSQCTAQLRLTPKMHGGGSKGSKSNKKSKDVSSPRAQSSQCKSDRDGHASSKGDVKAKGKGKGYSQGGSASAGRPRWTKRFGGRGGASV